METLRSWLALCMVLSSACLTSAEGVRDEAEPAAAELSCGETEQAQAHEPAAAVQVEVLSQVLPSTLDEGEACQDERVG